MTPQGRKILIEETITEDSSKLKKNMQIKEVQKMLSNFNLNYIYIQFKLYIYIFKHITLKVKITKRNEKILRATIGKSQLPAEK